MIYLKNLRLGILLMILFVLLATALPIIGSSIYKNFSSKIEDSRVTLYFHDSGETVKMSHDDYILGILLSQIDEDYGEETLRAAAVALRSASLYLRGACRELCYTDADYCDCSSSLSYMCREEYIKKHEEKGNILVSALSKAIEDTDGEVLLYKNSYALALVHKSSHITTESSFDVFGKEYPYLEPVITPEKAEINELFVLESELLNKLGSFFENMSTAGISASPVLRLNRAGRVENVNIYLRDISASEFAELFELKTMCFEIDEAYGGIIIRSYGEGNGVGMSLAGAKKMSENEFSYSDILLYYFRGCKIVSENSENLG